MNSTDHDSFVSVTRIQKAAPRVLNSARDRLSSRFWLVDSFSEGPPCTHFALCDRDPKPHSGIDRASIAAVALPRLDEAWPRLGMDQCSPHSWGSLYLRASAHRLCDAADRLRSPETKASGT